MALAVLRGATGVVLTEVVEFAAGAEEEALVTIEVEAALVEVEVRVMALVDVETTPVETGEHDTPPADVVQA